MESPPCTAARNVVLLGDPQQLEQPIQGSHPGGCDTNEEPSLDLDDWQCRATSAISLSEPLCHFHCPPTFVVAGTQASGRGEHPGGSEISEEDDLRAELERLRAKIEAIDANKDRIRLQVSVKGALSLYGIRRFPVTFYADEWETILEKSGEIRRFIAEHPAELKRKGA